MLKNKEIDLVFVCVFFGSELIIKWGKKRDTKNNNVKGRAVCLAILQHWF